MPQVDSFNKWRFEEDGLSLYHIYGGNVLNAQLSQLSNKYFLTVNGESDNGESQFKIALSSESPITTGIYETALNSDHLDSMYFKSNRNTSYIFSRNTYDGNNNTYCKIDTIDNQKVVGTIYGKLSIYLNPPNSTTPYVKMGSFRASF